MSLPFGINFAKPAPAPQVTPAQEQAAKQQLMDMFSPNKIPAANPVTVAPLSDAPNAPAQNVAMSAPAGPSRASTDPLLASLSHMDEILGNKNQASNDEYNTAMNGYNASDAIDSQNHAQNVARNESTYTKNNQAALLNAANAATGLRGQLSAMGSAGGSGQHVIDKLVGLAANSDAGAARGTFDTNAEGIGQSWDTAQHQAEQRKLEAGATHDNNLQNNEASVLNSKQSIFQQLAQLFGAGTAQGDDYASQASALAAPIAATTKASVAPYAASNSLFSPAALQSYLAGTQNLNVSTAGGSTPINAPAYMATQKKDQLSGVA